MSHIRNTAVCRNTIRRPGEKEQNDCGGGGWWGEQIPDRCPKCGGKLTLLAPTHITVLEYVDL